MRVPTGLSIDNPAFPLLQAGIAYWGITDGDGAATGLTLVCADLDNHPPYTGNRVKILTGDAWGQDRAVMVHGAGGILTVDDAFTDSSAAAVQIVSGTLFVILSNSGVAGGGGGGMPPTAGLWMFGIVSPGQVASTTVIDIPHLAGFENDTFNDEFYMQILHAGGAAPEGEKRIISDYAGATGRFTTDAFSANVEAGDIVAIFHSAIEAIDIIARGTLDTSSATVPADSTRTEGDDHFNGHLFVPTEGTYAGRATRIVEYTGAGGIFILDPNNPLPGASGLVDYIVIKSQAEFVPAADATINRTPADVIGNKTDTIPAMNAAPAATDSLVRHVKAILERVGATPADPDDSLLTSAGQRDATATADDLSDVTTTDIQAKLRRILLRMSSDAFTADIQGAARTELDTILAQLATYFVAAGAALSVTIDPGGSARTSLATLWNDLGQMLAGAAGITTWPASSPPGDGVSIAEAIRQIYDDLTAVNSGLQEQADTAVNITAIVASETDVFDLSAAGTRYVVRSLRLKAADPGANTISVRLYELINDVATLVETFVIDTNNYQTFHTLMDVFGVSHLAGDDLQITVQASAGGPYAVTGQIAWASAT